MSTPIEGLSITQFLILAFIAEAIWEICKQFYQKKALSTDRIGAAVIGLLLAFGARIDFLAMVGIPLAIPYLGYVVSGLLMSRGANVVHDIWSTVQGFMQTVTSRATVAANEAADKVIIPSAARKNGMKINIKPVTDTAKRVAKSASDFGKRTSDVLSTIRRHPTTIEVESKKEEPIKEDENEALGNPKSEIKVEPEEAKKETPLPPI